MENEEDAFTHEEVTELKKLARTVTRVKWVAALISKIATWVTTIVAAAIAIKEYFLS